MQKTSINVNIKHRKNNKIIILYVGSNATGLENLDPLNEVHSRNRFEFFLMKMIID